MAKFTPTISTEKAGITSNAFFRREASVPAIAPMMRELTARPIQPQVMTSPMAVPDMRGKASPTMASVVGKTGAMEIPARKTRTAAAPGLFTRSIRNVVIAMATEAQKVTVMAGT